MARAARHIEEELGLLHVSDRESARTSNGFQSAASIRAAVLEAEGRAAVERRIEDAKLREAAILRRAEAIQADEDEKLIRRRRRIATVKMVEAMEKANFGPKTTARLIQANSLKAEKSSQITPLKRAFPALRQPYPLTRPIRFAPIRGRAQPGPFPNPPLCNVASWLRSEVGLFEPTKGGYAIVGKLAKPIKTRNHLFGKSDPQSNQGTRLQWVTEKDGVGKTWGPFPYRVRHNKQNS